MIVDVTTAQRIGLDWLRAAVAPVGAFGRRHDETIAPYGPGAEALAQAEIANVVAIAGLVTPDAIARMRAALRAIPEPTPIAARARAGDSLVDVDFYELLRFADAVDGLAREWDAAGAPGAGRPVSVAALADVLAPGRTPAGFYLAGAFGDELASLRARVRDADARLDAQRRELTESVHAAIGIVPVGDEFVILRDVYDGPLPAGVRLVHDAPTYRSTALILDAAERDAALGAVAAAEEAARHALAARIAAQSDAISAATRSLGALDRLLSRVTFAQRWGACVPALAAARLDFEDAVFAPLAEALGERGHRYTPLSFALDGVAAVTGPNMGGKSAALATAGFLCACVAIGVAPPARRASLCLLDRIVWLGGEAPAERASLLSSYAAEVVRGRDALAYASPRALVLIDEFARTTGPREGRALLIALLEALRARGALALAATHFAGVAAAARVTHLRIAGLGTSFAGLDAADTATALEQINAAMDYRIVNADDALDTSDALALAQLLGLDADVVRRAHELYAQDASS
jgi:hypothetical protein